MLSSDLTRDDVRPYFLWDEAITVGELRRRLAGDVLRAFFRLAKVHGFQEWLGSPSPSQVLASESQQSRRMRMRRSAAQPL